MTYDEKFSKLINDPFTYNWVKQLTAELDGKDPLDVLQGLAQLTDLYKSKLDMLIAKNS